MDETMNGLIGNIAVLSEQPPEIVLEVVKRMAAKHHIPRLDMAYRLFYHLTDEPYQMNMHPYDPKHPIVVEFREEVAEEVANEQD